MIKYLMLLGLIVLWFNIDELITSFCIQFQSVSERELWELLFWLAIFLAETL